MESTALLSSCPPHCDWTALAGLSFIPGQAGSLPDPVDVLTLPVVEYSACQHPPLLLDLKEGLITRHTSVDTSAQAFGMVPLWKAQDYYRHRAQRRQESH